jgi:DNA-binding NtrC family response regulator
LATGGTISDRSLEGTRGLTGRILVVDDDPAQAFLASEILSPDGHEVETAHSGAEALEKLASMPFDLVLADLMMPRMDGFELLRRIGEKWDNLPVIFITGHDDVASAVQAIQDGAENYLTKPFDIDGLRFVVQRALERRLLRDDNARLRQMVHDGRMSFGTVIGASPPMQALYDQIERVAPTESTVLLLGESGTGKDLTAREIHRRSHRKGGPFLGVNCGALPANLLESELFGHEKGAFTGASAGKVGLFEAANGGTIFLDEIGTTTGTTQQTLLRVLQEREVRRVGSTLSRPIDVRVIAATNADLESDMKAGSFRADLYYRLSGIVLHLPALRERQGDIPLLAEHFLAQSCHRQGRELHAFSPRALERLQRHAWPGNIRELENVVERAVIFAGRRLIGPGDLFLEGAGDVVERPDPLALDEVIRSHLRYVVERCAGNLAQAARLLRIPRTSLYKKLQKYDLGRGDGQAES